ncbi:MAG: hypothetical protein EWV63_13710 [Microcystis aeruginosa Ma_OC_H_19870700_S124]|uniref:Uncharacterized protein n=1 Tax=Microcystis aeruginosa Ma_OC_H_19870700_S124 TaxID=2486262 RepID=A0A552AI77_MICAE|nr:MAG: hypothetical protein EWV63_13710 [Microcystis aeruginosa Ma_OC_H_19870700_S124]
MARLLISRLPSPVSCLDALILCVISLTYIGAINLCVLCVFVVLSTRSLVGLYLRIHFTQQT